MKRHHYQTRSKSNCHNELSRTWCSRQTATNQPHPRTDQLDSVAHSKCTYSRKQETQFLDLPPEIILLILITLPVKTLSILKCVNRYFSCFISRPDFIKDHLKVSSGDVSMSGYRVIISSFWEVFITDSQQISIPPIRWRESSVPSLNLVYLKKELVKRIRLVGCCNGLVFITINVNHLFIWNPTIRKHMKLPDIIKLESLNKNCYFSFGFGFDVSSDDYKVVLLAAQNKYIDFRSEKDYVVFVYSLKRGSWMRIPDLTGGMNIVRYGMFASGHLHWSTRRLDIVSFDVEREVFGTLVQPNYAKGCLNVALGVIGGSICVSYGYSGFIDVWIMKEYGKIASWNKIITLPSSIAYAYPYTFLPNGEVLVIDRYLQAYNPVHKSSYLCEVQPYSHSLIYVESLVPPFCNCQDTQN